MAASQGSKTISFLQSHFPVLLPYSDAAYASRNDFEQTIEAALKLEKATKLGESLSIKNKDADPASKKSYADVANKPATQSEASQETSHTFISSLAAFQQKPETPDLSSQGKGLTENQDVTYVTSMNVLVDLLQELEETMSGDRLITVLGEAWKADPLMTLKIIFNARSIHLGKGSRHTFYRCIDWLARVHPGTLLVNLPWLVRPVIERKLGEKKEANKDNEDFEMLDAEGEDDMTQHDVATGVAHGYWKDLLNILVLSADNKFDSASDPSSHLYKKRSDEARRWTSEEAKKKRGKRLNAQNHRISTLLENGGFYFALHYTVARLFADQLKADLALLRNKDKRCHRKISLCAKWAPSSKLAHDSHTFIVSTIAEIMHPQAEMEDVANADRSLYLLHAREAYRRDISALRAALLVVERDISAKEYSKIDYKTVPSLAMKQYTKLFATKDETRFDEYLNKVAEGQAKISGAILLPSVMVKDYFSGDRGSYGIVKKKTVQDKVKSKVAEMTAKAVEGQWDALVQRIRDSGALKSSIAVCDVSGSMYSPMLSDSTVPLHSSIGLSLLLAEVAEPPFGGAMITFASDPGFIKVGGPKDKRSLPDKVQAVKKHGGQGYSTNFVAVFEKLILPMALEYKLKQEQMVKQIFVFSDMQFNQAEAQSSQWSTSYERIKNAYKRHGYEMPTLVFWNLAGSRVSGGGNKPVHAEEPGTAMVSGYSQGMLKVFMDNGSFEDPDEEQVVTVKKNADGTEETVVEKQKITPESLMRKAVSHKAYSMLRVVD